MRSHTAKTSEGTRKNKRIPNVGRQRAQTESFVESLGHGSNPESTAKGQTTETQKRVQRRKRIVERRPGGRAEESTELERYRYGGGNHLDWVIGYLRGDGNSARSVEGKQKSRQKVGKPRNRKKSVKRK